MDQYMFIPFGTFFGKKLTECTRKGPKWTIYQCTHTNSILLTIKRILNLFLSHQGPVSLNHLRRIFVSKRSYDVLKSKLAFHKIKKVTKFSLSGVNLGS